MEYSYIRNMNIPRRYALAEIARKLDHNPGVIMLGARQVGKTTLVKEVAHNIEGEYPLYIDLESFNDMKLLEEDPEGFLTNYEHTLVIIDEVQVYPQLFAVLRSLIDRNRRNGRFLLLGSADPRLVKGVSESLAGRVSYLDLSPLSLLEVGYESVELLWLRGGFPRAYLAESDSIFLEWVSDYIRSYSERDIGEMFGFNIDSSLIKRLWRMLAVLHSTTLNIADLSRSLGVTFHTVDKYIGFLEGAYMLFKLAPWHANVGKRLVKSPKVYISDSGLLHGLMGLDSFKNLLHHPIIGASWEGFVIQQIKIAVSGILELFFYRTHNGTEVDLVLVHGFTPLASVEIKNSNNPSIPKGFYIGIADLKTKNNYVITRSSQTYMQRDVKIISLVSFLRDEISWIIKSIS